MAESRTNRPPTPRAIVPAGTDTSSRGAASCRPASRRRPVRPRWRRPCRRCAIWIRDDIPTVEEFLQKHYKEMTPEDKQQVFDRIRREVEQRYHVCGESDAIRRRWTASSSSTA